MGQQDVSRFQPNRRLSAKLATYFAAGTSLLTTDAEGAIVHRSFGPMGVLVVNDSFEIDLDGDQVSEFAIMHEHKVFPPTSGCDSDCYTNSFAQVKVVRLDRVSLLGSSGNRYPQAFRSGELIATDNPYTPDSNALRVWGRNGGVQWNTGQFNDVHRYLGIRFMDLESGSQRAAWLSIVMEPKPTNFRLFGYAYETEPGKPILAGDTGPTTNTPGDTDADGQVDIIDLNNVRNNFGATGDGVLGDANGDDLVNIEDLNAVRNNFGAGNPVPEPPSLVLLAAGAAGLAMLRRRRDCPETA